MSLHIRHVKPRTSTSAHFPADTDPPLPCPSSSAPGPVLVGTPHGFQLVSCPPTLLPIPHITQRLFWVRYRSSAPCCHIPPRMQSQTQLLALKDRSPGLPGCSLPLPLGPTLACTASLCPGVFWCFSALGLRPSALRMPQAASSFPSRLRSDSPPQAGLPAQSSLLSVTAVLSVRAASP